VSDVRELGPGESHLAVLALSERRRWSLVGWGRLWGLGCWCGMMSSMSLVIREMTLDEVDLIIDYFHGSTPEHLETMGVDPTRLPTREDWREWYVAEYGRPVRERSTLLVIWELDGVAVGFSSADRIVYGEQAHMHLHIVDPQRRRSGIGAACVRETVELYFNELALRFLFCEPNAFNVAPNRTLQSVGFRYVKTYKTVPGPLNYHQAVTRWVLEGPLR
jgi:RimJ/RimL family protein N-acetyltransferase